jgi:SAM-dependent methyltransferase
MGRSNSILSPIYQSFPLEGSVALLGFTDNQLFKGDLYDLQLDNWDINSQWELPKKYDTIISTRCPYFAKDPKDFIKRCYNNLNPGGTVFLDWGLGDHWRFENYKIGWVKGKEHEYCYKDDNYLWSTVWDDEFLEENEFKKFSTNLNKFGYKDIKQAIYNEVPVVLELSFIKKYFNISYKLLSLWEDKPQLYIFIEGKKL